MAALSKEQVADVCKLRGGVLCCSFLMMGSEFECSKGTPLEANILARREAGTMNAKGDNCSGPPDFEATAVDAKEAPA